MQHMMVGLLGTMFAFALAGETPSAIGLCVVLIIIGLAGLR